MVFYSGGEHMLYQCCCTVVVYCCCLGGLIMWSCASVEQVVLYCGCIHVLHRSRCTVLLCMWCRAVEYVLYSGISLIYTYIHTAI